MCVCVCMSVWPIYILYEDKPVNAFVHLHIERCVDVYIGVVKHVSQCVNTCVLACNTFDAELVYGCVKACVCIPHLSI